MSRFAFGPFILDTESRALLRDGERLAVAGRTLDTLVVLVQNRGRLIEKDQLLSLVWPGTVVEESNLSQSIFTLRKILGDSPKRNRYIATVAGRGYQFVAPATELPPEAMPSVHPVPDARAAQESQPPLTTRVESPPISKSLPSARQRMWTTISAVTALVVLAGAIFFFSHSNDRGGTRLGLWFREIGIEHRPADQTTISESRLTANPDDTPVTSGVISPDGKFLAYTDRTGLYLRQVDNGETNPIPLPKGIDPLLESWLPDGVHLLASWPDNPEKPPGLWQISVVGGAPRKLIEEGSSASPSPDGSQIAFIKQARSGEEVWLIAADGANARKLTGSLEESFSRPAWAPDGRRFAYARTKTRYYASRRSPDTQIEVFDLRSWHTAVVISQGDRGLPRGGVALGWTRDARLIYPRREPRPNQQDTNLWWVRLDPKTAHAVGPSTRITNGRGIAVQLSLSSDGKRLALRRHAPQPDIYVAELVADGKKLSPPRRLTLDERLDYAMAWTADSKEVVFYSNRDGPFHVFKQAIDSTQPELVAGGKADLYVPRLSPDGSSVIYVVRAEPGGSSDNAQVMRVLLSGGPPQLVLEAPDIFDVQCARPPSNLCFYAQTQAGKARFFTFDPVKGKGLELSVASKADTFNWSMSPDGKYFAWPSARTTLNQPGIRIFSIDGEWKRDIPVPGWVDIYGLDWAPDCKSLWACAHDTKGNSALLSIGLNGKVTTMSSYRSSNLLWTIPSPDGRHLAIVEERNTSNVWLLENF